MEITILQWFENIRNPMLNGFFSFYTALGNHGEIWFLIILVMAINKKTRPLALCALIALACEFILIDGVLKQLFMRPRPFRVYPFELLIKAPSGFSFPSGHAGSSFAVATVVVFFKFKQRWLILAMAFLMAISRLYHCVHYPSDVLVGALIGTAIGGLVWLVYQTVQKSVS